MKKRTMTILSCALALVASTACRKETPPPPETTSAIATATVPVARDASRERIEVTIPLIPNAVSACEPVKPAFKVGEPLQIRMQLNESPEKLSVGARVVNEAGDVVAWVSTPAKGSRDVIVSVAERVEPGKYVLEGYWGGNVVCEHPIEVTK